MNYDFVIFGKSSILSKNFVRAINKNQHQTIFITRTAEENNDILCDIGEKLHAKDIKEINLRIKQYSRFKKKIFILFSWSGGPRTSSLKESYIWSKNKNIMLNFFKICTQITPYRIIFLSSAGAIYPQNKDQIFNELDNTEPISNYGKQKLKAEVLLEKFSKINNIKSTILRVSSACGFDQRFSDQGVINKWLYSAIKGQNLKLYNSKKSKINFISFQQISEALVIALKYELDGIYNIGSNKSYTLQEVIDNINKIMNKKNNVEIVNDEIRYFSIDTNKFASKTGIDFDFDLKRNIKILYKLIYNSLN